MSGTWRGDGRLTMAERSHRQPLRAGALGLAAVALAACGSGACEGPDGDDGETIGFQLPVGNETAAGPAEQQVYEALSESCADGQRALDQLWQQIERDQTVLAFQAAIEACEGDIQAAVVFRDDATDEGTLARGTLECDLLRLITGMAEQIDPDSVPCTGDASESPPPTTAGPERGDPRIEVFESLDDLVIDGSTTTEPGSITRPGETTTTADSTTTSLDDGSITADTDAPAIG
jgi:hypothetical protein